MQKVPFRTVTTCQVQSNTEPPGELVRLWACSARGIGSQHLLTLKNDLRTRLTCIKIAQPTYCMSTVYRWDCNVSLRVRLIGCSLLWSHKKKAWSLMRGLEARLSGRVILTHYYG